jgi:outer membrane protein
MKVSSALRFATILCLAGLGLSLGAGGLRAQQGPANTPASAVPTPSATLPPGATTVDYSNSTHEYSHVLAPWVAPEVPEPALSNSQLIRSLTRGGKLHLSLDDAIALALEDNLDIAVVRYDLPEAQLDYLRTKGGGASRGVAGAFQSQALFAGAVGAGISGFSGASNTSAGGAIGGAGAVNVGAIGCCDPTTGFNFGWSHNVNPLNFSTVNLAPTTTTQQTSMSGFLGQGFLTGTSFALSLSGFRESTTSPAALFNPEVPMGLTFGIVQHLLNGFGYRANAKFIRIAQNDLRFADTAFRLQVITTISKVVNDYYTLLYDRENVRVAQEAVNYSERLLSDNKKQVEIGTLAPIEVVRAESEVASDQQALIVAQTTLRQQEEVLKTELAKQVGPDLVGTDIEPTDSFPDPRPDDIPPLPQALQLAIKNRPELEETRLNLRNMDITLKAVRNQLLPTLDAFAAYAPQGLSGNQAVYGCPAGATLITTENVCTTSTGARFPATITGINTGGLGDSFSNLLHADFPAYSFGITLTLPVRNRVAQADAARAQFEQRQFQTQLQNQRNAVEQDVRNAEIATTQAKAQIDAASKAIDLARQTLEADRKKFQLGETTTFQLIQDQRDLATAEGNGAKARQAYATALTQFAQATATILDKYHVQMADARSGKVTHPPNIPGAQPTESSAAQ